MASFNALRGIAFDLDGTLVHSAPELAQAVDYALSQQDLPVAGEARVSTWIGNGSDVLIERALNWAGADAALFEKTRTLFNQFYAQTLEDGSPLFPQVKETLARLRDAGFQLALVTNKPTPFVAPLLATLGIADYFATAVGGDDVVVKKPHPAPLYLVLARLGLRAQEMLFVGDSRNDIEAAQAAGCPNVGLTYGYNYGQAISLSQPTLVLDHFADLLPALGLPPLDNQEH